ncbi:adhesin [Pseudomonas citronellolis]|uniref:adhesin n=1 Tax=Pseudomonas citronellolis TaxID=53408 RepID=UPI0023E3BC61|nr:adhesin [Pseudomonas citronellolis]MDF3932343.1 adhesin [Pseudomonas citronellolis]
MKQHALLSGLLALFCGAALADGAPTPMTINQSTLSNVAPGYHGNVGVNQAAGDAQQQANGRAIAIGSQAQASTRFTQSNVTSTDLSQSTRSSIEGNSFANGSGAVGVNQAAGAGSQQVNAMRISISAYPQGMDDSELSQQSVTLLPNSGAGGSTSGERRVDTSDQAFRSSQGVVQLNQSAGVGNHMANTLSIRVAD